MIRFAMIRTEDRRKRTAPAGRKKAAEFIPEGDLQARLRQLLQDCPAPGKVVLVTGPPGSGKSPLYQQLASSLAPELHPACVEAGRGKGLAEVLATILRAYGFSVEEGTDVNVMSDLIAHHAADEKQPGRICVVLIDDAHQLETGEMQQLLALVGRSALMLVMFGPVSLVGAIERVARQVRVDWRELKLTGLSPEDVGAYLGWRFPQADHGGSMPFSEQEIKELARRSNGLPGRIDELATKLLEKAGYEGRGPGPWGFPVRHLVLVTGLVLVVLIVFVVGLLSSNGEATGEPAPARKVETLAMPPLPAAGEAENRTSAVPGAGDEPVERTPISRPAPPAEPDQAPASAPAIIARPPAPAPAQPAQAPAVAAPPPAATTPAPTAAAVPPAAGRATAAGSPKSADWIMSQPPQSFTLQLVSLSSAEGVAAYIAQQSDPSAFATYRLMLNGQVFHVVVHGSYASRAEAEQAAARLPKTVGLVQPWIRPFGQVQESVRTATQQ